MNSRRNSVPTNTDGYGVAAGYVGDLNNGNYQNAAEQVRWKRGKRRKSITVTRRADRDMPAIRPKSPAPRPMMKRSDSNISRVSVASDFATIAEDAVCEDFTGDVRQSYPPMTAVRRVSFSSSPPLNRRSSSSSVLGSSCGDDERPRRRVSVISLQRSDSTVSSLMGFNERRLSTVSDAVMIRRNRLPKRRGSADGYGENVRQNRRASAEAHSLLTGRKSFPPRSSSERFHLATGPAYRSYPPPYLDNVLYESDDDSGGPREPSMAETDDLSYEATLRRASLASIHEMHHAVTLLKNQKALAKLGKERRNSSYGDGRSSGDYDSRRSSLRGSSSRQSLDSVSGHARGSTAMDTHLRRLSVSSSIQDMHQQVALVKEKRLVKQLNSKVQFSVVEDARRPSDRRGSTASARRRASAGGSSISAVSLSSMSAGRRSTGSEDSDSYSSSSGDYSSSPSGSSSSDYSSASSSYYSDTDDSFDSDEDATSSDDSREDSDGGHSPGGERTSDGEDDASDGEDSASDGGQSVASTGTSTATDSGNGTLSSSHGSKGDGRPKSAGQDVAGPSGQAARRASQIQHYAVSHPESYLDSQDASHQQSLEKNGGDGGRNPRVVHRGHTQSKACVIL